MTGDDKKKRPAPISYRPPASLRDEFDFRVKMSGKSVNAFITQSIFARDVPRQHRRPVVEKELLAKLLFEAGRIADALHVISDTDDLSPVDPGELDEALVDLTELRAAVLKAMGRSP